MEKIHLPKSAFKEVHFCDEEYAQKGSDHYLEANMVNNQQDYQNMNYNNSSNTSSWRNNNTSGANHPQNLSSTTNDRNLSTTTTTTLKPRRITTPTVEFWLSFGLAWLAVLTAWDWGTEPGQWALTALSWALNSTGKMWSSYGFTGQRC